ncbi:MAG: Gfo/Idh/MocA family oxidoreductase [Thermodesulfobacteria bacterium]|nr:Gfo/Idh/MocA family oxidoreductase [Thermodesulfobacteriota bacterium]
MALKGAIIGFGHIAANGHVPAFKSCKEVEICAVCDSCVDRSRLNSELLDGSRFYTSVEELFQQEPIDFVDVATPPASHAKFIIEALSRGKHVLCEKPLVLSTEDLASIKEAMEGNGCCVVTVHNWRYSPIMQEISSTVRGGSLGEIRHIEYLVERVKPSVAVGDNGDGNNWRLDPSVAGGGILVDHGWHAFYLVNEWMGQEPKALECRLENRKFMDIPVEDTAEVKLFYPSGATARLFFTWAGEKRDNSVFIQGENGKLSCLDDRIDVETDENDYSIRFDEGLSAGSHHPEWYFGVVEEFLSEVKNGSRRNFAEAATCLNILEGCKRSNASTGQVTLDSFVQNGVVA